MRFIIMFCLVLATLFVVADSNKGKGKGNGKGGDTTETLDPTSHHEDTTTKVMETTRRYRLSTKSGIVASTGGGQQQTSATPERTTRAKGTRLIQCRGVSQQFSLNECYLMRLIFTKLMRYALI